MPRWTPEEIDAQTPADRYRFADFLRVASILVVVFGHWFLLIVTVRNGTLVFDHMLSAVPPTRWLTWVFQVMPIFFMVGGYANALSLRSAAEKGQRGTDWLRARAMRLYWPLIPLLIVWSLLAGALVGIGTSTDVVTLVTQVVLVPAWFLAAYLGVVSLAPLTYRLHRRYGVAAIAAMGGLAVAVDLLSRLAGIPFIGWATYLFVWVTVHQVGYFWEDRRLPQGLRGRLAMGLGGYACLAVLVFVAGYPLSMVGPNGTGAQAVQTNTTPPSIALIALGLGQLGFLLAVERPITAWLERPVVWARVVMMGSIIMTVYLWHMTAMVAVAAAAFPTGIWPATDAIDATFWWTRPLWFLTLLVALALIVKAFHRFERSPASRPTSLPGVRGRVLAGLGVVATGMGLALLVLGGLYSETGPLGIPILPISMLVLGLLALGVIGGQSRRPPQGRPAGR